MKYVKTNDGNYICDEITTYGIIPLRVSLKKYLRVKRKPSKSEIAILNNLIERKATLSGIKLADVESENL